MTYSHVIRGVKPFGRKSEEELGKQKKPKLRKGNTTI